MPRILAVGDHYDAHRLGVHVAGEGAHVIDVLRGDVETARLLEAVAELLTGLAHGRGIDVGVISSTWRDSRA